MECLVSSVWSSLQISTAASYSSPATNGNQVPGNGGTDEVDNVFADDGNIGAQSSIIERRDASDSIAAKEDQIVDSNPWKENVRGISLSLLKYF